MKTIILSRQSHQQGFIQGAIIFALALVAIIIATFSSGASDTADNVNKEQAKAFAGQTISAGAKIETAYFRAQADRRVPFDGGIADTNLLVKASAGSIRGAEWSLASYAQFPNLDNTMFRNNTPGNWSVVAHNFGVTNTNSVVVELNNLQQSVCTAINQKLTLKIGSFAAASTLTRAQVASNNFQKLLTELGSTPIEGCYNNSSSYTYFKVLHAGFRAD